MWRYDGKQWVAWGGPKPDAGSRQFAINRREGLRAETYAMKLVG